MKKNNAIIAQPSPARNSCFNFLITGANFGNKGAESMLYVTTNELVKRFPDCNIYFASQFDTCPQEIYKLKQLRFSSRAVDIALGGFVGLKALIKGIIKDTIKILIGRKNLEEHYFELAKIIPSISAIVDISGFAFGSKWGDFIPYSYINKIKLARKHNIPVYLMPQSFGPFDYSPLVMQELKKIFADVLTYPRIIFAREKEGYDLLRELFGLKQVQLSADIVLQNSGIDADNIFKVPPVISVPQIKGKLAGVVPNMRCFERRNKNEFLRIYKEVIDYILEQGFKVVLFRHSREDLEVCKLIKNFFPNNEEVIIIENEFNCLEYNEFVKQFKFLVCSRYHGLVHAYKNLVPCVALGWAVKYKSLAENLEQSQYVFDITNPQTDGAKVIDALSRLLANYEAEQAKINERIIERQKYNCFDIFEEDFRKITGKI